MPTSEAGSMDTAPAFGHFRPRAIFGTLITAAQRAPRNWFGKQIAQAARKIVILCARLPIDVSVGALNLRCHLRDNNSERKFVFLPWLYDTGERQLLLDAVPLDGVFVDVGANIGIYTLCVATAMGPNGHIVALEPNPQAYRRMRFNIDATRGANAAWPRIDALQLGVSDADTELDLHLDPTNLGGSSVAMHVPDVAARTTGGAIRIACRPMLTILKELGVKRVDAMKIDIEGAEDMALLPYLAEAADEYLPGCLIVENSEPLWRGDLPAALRERGYRPRMRSRLNTVYHRGQIP